MGNSDENSYAQHLTMAHLLSLLFLSVGAMVFVSDGASAQQQQRNQVHCPSGADQRDTRRANTGAAQS
jgi:hypothetical protein